MKTYKIYAQQYIDYDTRDWLCARLPYHLYKYLLENGKVIINTNQISIEAIKALKSGMITGVFIPDPNAPKKEVIININHNFDGRDRRYLKIPRIKEIRRVSKIGLKEAKELVEDMEDNDRTFVLEHPISSTFNDKYIKNLEDVGFSVIINLFDILPDELFTI